MDHYTALTVTHAIHAPVSVYLDHVESTFRHGIVRLLLGAASCSHGQLLGIQL